MMDEHGSLRPMGFQSNSATALILLGLLGFLIAVRRGFRGHIPSL